MKKSIVLCSILLLASLTSFAEDQIILKSCTTILKMGANTLPNEVKIDIYANGKSLVAISSHQELNGQVLTRNDVVKLIHEEVRADLTGKFENLDSLNLAERLISRAILLTEDPIFEHAFSAGLDLKKIRSANVYTIGSLAEDAANMVLVAIVEAKDESGNDLGSFFGGFLLSSCR